MVLIDVIKVLETCMHAGNVVCSVPLPVEFDVFEVNAFRVCSTLIGYLWPTKHVFPKLVINKSSIFLSV